MSTRLETRVDHIKITPTQSVIVITTLPVLFLIGLGPGLALGHTYYVSGPWLLQS